MPTPHKHAALIKAWADGATIEYLDRGVDWGPTGTAGPTWDVSVEYRIKPTDKFQVLAYKPVRDGNGWVSNRPTFQLDPAATQWSLGRTDGESNQLFLFDTYKDADAACRAVNKSLTNS